MGIYSEIAARAGTNPAAYLSSQLFTNAMTERLLSVASTFQGKTIPVGPGVLSAIFDGFGANWKPQAVLQDDAALPGAVDIRILLPLVVGVEIVLSKSPKTVITTISLQAENICARLTASNNSITVSNVRFDQPPKTTIVRDGNALANLKAAGIDPTDAARIEGYIVYAAIPQTVAIAISPDITIDLASIFPAINFGTSIRLFTLDGGRALGIFPADDATSGNMPCTCGYEVNRRTQPTQITRVNPANPTIGQPALQVNLGGPVPDGKDPLKDFGPRRAGKSNDPSGLAGIYIPKPIAIELAPISIPPFNVTVQSDALIGYTANGHVAVKSAPLHFDAIEGAFIVKVYFAINERLYDGLGTVDCNPMKGVRAPVGAFVFTNSGLIAPSITLGFYPAIDSNGGLVLQNQIISSDLGTYIIMVMSFTDVMALFGGLNGFISFIADTILGQLVGRDLPGRIEETVGAVLQGLHWTLIQTLAILDEDIMGDIVARFQVGNGGGESMLVDIIRK